MTLVEMLKAGVWVQQESASCSRLAGSARIKVSDETFASKACTSARLLIVRSQFDLAIRDKLAQFLQRRLQ